MRTTSYVKATYTTRACYDTLEISKLHMITDIKDMEITVKINDYHKRISCDVCGKSMRSDNLKRHKLTHKDLLSLPDDEIKQELKARHTIEKEKEIKRKRIE